MKRPFQNTYLFFDTETTGLPLDYQAPLEESENWPRMVQLAYEWYGYNPGEPPKLFESVSRIIQPDGYTIPADMIHGITTARARREGVWLGEVLNEFMSTANRSQALIAHNISFDFAIVGAETYRLGGYQPHPMGSDYFTMPQFCTKLLSTDYCAIPSPYGKKGYKWPTLQELHWHLFDEDFDNAHDALADVKACARCFFELKKRGVL